jgi:signal transduction histidine kinase
MPLDNTTLFVALIGVSAMASAFVWFLYSGHRPMRGIRSIAASNTLLLLGFTGIALRASLPPFVSFVVTNTLICIGYVLVLHGMAEFLGKRSRPTLLAALVVAYCCEYTYFTYVVPSYAVRLFTYLCFYASVMLAVLRMLMTEYADSRIRSHLVAASMAGFLAISFLLCAVMSLRQTDANDILSTTTINALVVLEQLVFVIGWTLAFTLMVGERLAADKLRAEIASREKSDALANMSHELRTPLNAIIGFADAIDQQALGPDNPKYQGYIKDILGSGRYLLLLIDDILDISRIEAGMLELQEEELAVADLVGSVLRLIAPQGVERGVTVEAMVAPTFTTLRADPLRVRQILLNLLTNAIKYTPAGGRVRLSATAGPDGANFTVTDTGVGMDAKGIERALTKYCRVETAFTRGREGVGLGLPLAVALTKAHGGRLDVTSTPGEGTTVTAAFPPERCRQREPVATAMA